ncbi:acyloxyacyl hydrolase [Oceaniserpentilla sp. 4NH20-0058]|uniref:acyloxyacyl hydrolase n=1 Tax=Oceaniserpentilla sp. 4NH20-0058 TaxID=3127660 RepID=UPI00333F13EB
MFRTLVLVLCLSSPQWAYAVAEELTEEDTETWGWRTALFSSLFLSLAMNPLGADEYNASIMMSEDEDVGAVKFGFKWHKDDLSFDLFGAEVTHYYLLGYSYWQSLDIDGQEGVVNAVEFVPVFRFNWSYSNWLSYLETSVGLSVLSRSGINDKRFSTNFQFTDSLSFGGYITPKSSWSLQLQHFSNNSIKLPNNGINFYNFNYAYRY